MSNVRDLGVKAPKTVIGMHLRFNHSAKNTQLLSNIDFIKFCDVYRITIVMNLITGKYSLLLINVNFGELTASR